jgi:FkbM family methyltransferase
VEELKTINITYAGRSIALPDLPDYAKFYRKLASGTWEPRTFEVLARSLDRDTVYVDIGAWIGVTPFWASQIAKAVVAVEPDPRCLDILRALSPSYPNLTLLQGALSPEAKVTIHAVDGFGSSESSILDIGDGSSAVSAGITLDEIMKHAGSSQAFVKIDIEGYEFAAAGEIAKLRNYNVRGLQLAVHPQLYEKSLAGGWLGRRLQTTWKAWRLARLFRGTFPAPTLAKYSSVLSYIALGIIFRKVPRGADFVFERISAKHGMISHE